jgi:hypothetical protein
LADAPLTDLAAPEPTLAQLKQRAEMIRRTSHALMRQMQEIATQIAEAEAREAARRKRQG